MTERTPPNTQPRHALRVLDGGLNRALQPLDDAAAWDRARLAEEIAEAERLCDRLEADGLRIAFELDGSKPGIRVSVRDDDGHDVRPLALSEVADVARLAMIASAGS